MGETASVANDAVPEYRFVIAFELSVMPGKLNRMMNLVSERVWVNDVLMTIVVILLVAISCQFMSLNTMAVKVLLNVKISSDQVPNI